MVATGKRLGDPRVYAVGKEYLTRGWQTDDSVFTPGHRVLDARGVRRASSRLR